MILLHISLQNAGSRKTDIIVLGIIGGYMSINEIPQNMIEEKSNLDE